MSRIYFYVVDIIFYTKNPYSFLKYLDELEKFLLNVSFIFLITLARYKSDVQP